MKFKLLFAALLSYCSVSTAYAQQSAVGPTRKNIQPKIIVIPKVTAGKDIKTVYDADGNIQVALAKINEAFLKRGANLRSFDQVLKQVEANKNINKVSGNTDDYKAMVLQNSGADIYVEVKLDVVNHPARNAKSVNLLLEAYQTGTSNLMSSKTVPGPMFQTEDIGSLTMSAMDEVSEEFLNLLQQKFDDIIGNGQSVYIEFTIAPGSKSTFDDEVANTGNKALSEVMDDWLQAHAVNGSVNTQGVTTTKIIISDMRIPLKRPENPNANYTAQNLYNDIARYMRSIGFQAKRETATNNKLMITISN